MTPPGRHHLFSVTALQPQDSPAGTTAVYTVIGTTGSDGMPIPAVAVRRHWPMARACDERPAIDGAAWLIHVEAMTTGEAMARGAAAARIR